MNGLDRPTVNAPAGGGPAGNGGTSWATSWKLWGVLLLLGLLLIAATILMPAFRRLRAFQYLDQKGFQYELTARNEWLSDLLGENGKGFREVHVISMDPVSVSDETLFHLSEFEEITFLIWRQNGNPMSISSRGVEALRRLNQLETLILKGPGFSDELLSEWFSAHPPLQRLDLCLVDVSSKTLHELTEIPTLSRLCITHSTIADEAFEGLPPTTALTELYVPGTQAGDRCAEWASGSPAINFLNMAATSISDEGLAHLGKVHRLQGLNLTACRNISPAGIKQIEGLPDLLELGISSSIVTASSIESLQRFPRLRTITVVGTVTDSGLQETLERHWDYVER